MRVVIIKFIFILGVYAVFAPASAWSQSSQSRGSVPFMPGLLPAEMTAITYSGWILPNGSTPSHQNRGSVQTPIYKEGAQTWAAGISGSQLHVDNAPTFSNSGLKPPSDLSTLDFSTQYSRKLEEEKTFGGRLVIGSASDQVFAGANVTTFAGTVDYSYPSGENTRWLLSAFISNNSPIINYVPIPGFAYIYMSPKISGVFGFPFSNVRWVPDDLWTVSVGLLGVNFNSEISYGLTPKLQSYLGYNQVAQTFMQKDRINDRDRLYFQERRVQVGLKYSLMHIINLDFAIGSAYDRKQTIQSSYFSASGVNVSELDSAWYAQLNVRAIFK